jgi:alpha,alpha-trehalase
MTEMLVRPSSQPPEAFGPAMQCIDEIHTDFFRGLHESGEFTGDMIEAVWLQPRLSAAVTNAAYAHLSTRPGFSHAAFTNQFFSRPIHTRAEGVRFETGDDYDDFTGRALLAHRGRAHDNPTTYGLPNDVVESGGRYSDSREGHAKEYYWDGLWIVRGLDVLGEYNLSTGIVDNKRHQIDRFGRPLNANGPEYRGRTQLPVYCRMARRDVAREGSVAWERHLPALEAEYAWWMQGADDPSKLSLTPGKRYRSVARMPNGSVANVFSAEGFTHVDGTARPRPESYPADMATLGELKESLGRELTQLEAVDACEEQHTGAGAATDYADWMLGDGTNMHTNRVTKRVPPFLNAVLFELECTIAEGRRATGHEAEALDMEIAAWERAEMMREFLYNPQLGTFVPFDLETGRQVLDPHLQDGAFAINAGITTPGESASIQKFWQGSLLDKAGLWMSTRPSKQSWSGPNFWPPMAEEAVTACWLTGNQALEHTLVEKTNKTIETGLVDTGYTKERYHASHFGQRGVAGEYVPPEHNFSWTLAVHTSLRHGGYRNEKELKFWLNRQRVAQGLGRLSFD